MARARALCRKLVKFFSVRVYGLCARRAAKQHSEADIFRKILKKEVDQLPKEETLADKILRAYACMKLRADKRNKRRKTGKTRWRPQIEDFVLAKRQPVSDAILGVISKFQRPYEGPYLIHREINPSIFELAHSGGKLRGIFHLKHLKPHLAEDSCE
jgi:hypothetical protein